MYLLILILLAVCILMPLMFAWRILRLDIPTKGGWLLVVADALVFTTLIFLVGRWDMAGLYTRPFLVALVVAATVRSLRRHAARPWVEGGFGELMKTHWTTLVSLVPFTGALIYVAVGLLPPGDAEDLVFPLAHGRFVVAQGGGNSLLNHHAGHSAQRHAVDIGAVYPLGFRARGVLPQQLEDYAVFGRAVVSPCRGRVISAGDQLPDLIPPQRDRENAIGNHAIIDCGRFNVELAHLMQGSLTVAAGDEIAAAQPVGKVGNSGNTTEPHLHIHAVDPQSGLGLPIAFNGSFPIRNSVYLAESS